MKPIPVRIPVKDKANDCTLFAPRLTVARDAPAGMPTAVRDRPQPYQDAPRNSSDSRNAFDRLFKKEE